MIPFFKKNLKGVRTCTGLEGTRSHQGRGGDGGLEIGMGWSFPGRVMDIDQVADL
jgi:hypothetical protein